VSSSSRTPPGVAVAVALAVPVGSAVAVSVGDGLNVALGALVPVGLGEGATAVAVGLALRVELGTAVALGAAVTLAVAVGVAERCPSSSPHAAINSAQSSAATVPRIRISPPSLARRRCGLDGRRRELHPDRAVKTMSTGLSG
jgi:hypothetical protein